MHKVNKSTFQIVAQNIRAVLDFGSGWNLALLCIVWHMVNYTAAVLVAVVNT